MNRLVQVTLGSALAVLCLLLAPLSASAIDTSDPSPSPNEPAPSDPLPESEGTTTGQIGDCNAVAGPSYLGLSCGSYTGGGLTVKQILGKDPVPGCWHEPLTAAELSALSYQNTPGPDGESFYWERCLQGIDRKTKTVGPEGVSFTIGIVSRPNDQGPKTLTDRQRNLVDFQGVDEQVPSPVVVTSPSARPRVGADVSFFDPIDNEVRADAGAVQLIARVTATEVQPLGEGRGDVLTCPGTGHQAKAGDTPQTHPRACWYRYEKSSAGEDATSDDLPAYPVLVTQQWRVTSALAGGPEQQFTTFEKSQVTALPVTEIQSLVIR